MPRHTLSVATSERNTRLDRFLAHNLPPSVELSRTSLTRLIKQGKVQVDQKSTTTPSLTLHNGQQVSITIPDPTNPERPPITNPHKTEKETPLQILYEDEHLLCFVKPANLTTHPAPSVAGETLVDRLKTHCAPHLAGYPQDPRCGIVHRLDKQTSGVMVAAKTEQTKHALCKMFARHDLERRYLALVWGVPALLADTIEAALARHPVQRTRMAVRRDSRQGKGRLAVTHYRCKQAFGDNASLLCCTLETGRTHQIRAHLSSIGHPVIGDPLYADPNPPPHRRAFAATLPAMSVPRQALHAEHLAFTHPITTQPLACSAPPPHDFQTLLDALSEGRETKDRTTGKR